MPRPRLVSSAIVLALTIGFCAPTRAAPASANADSSAYNVRAFGATGDGKTLDTDALNRAIEAAAAAGGGTVVLPAGTYLSFSLRLKSNITLHLEAGAILAAANPAADSGGYDAPEPNEWGDRLQYQDFGHSHWHNSLIWGENLVNVAITGPGRIDGSKGLSRMAGGGRGRGGAGAGPNGTAAPGTPPPVASPIPGNGIGNKAIALKNCRNVLIRDVSLLLCGHFALLATGVDQLTIDNVKVDTNRDGFDIDACRHVRISNCSVNSPNDDGIVLKTSYALGESRACENVTITNCEVSGYDAGSFLDGTYKTTQERAPDRDGPTGRIKLGTESNGGFRNITIANCVFTHCRGLALETVDGGVIEDVTITNLAMRDIANSPIFLRLGNRARGPEGTPVGAIRRVIISNVTVKNADPRYPSLIAGLPGHPIEDVQLSNIQVEHRGGLTLEQVKEQPAALVNTFFLRGPGLTGPRDPFAPPEQEKAYPEPSMFGLLPAHAFYIRHVKGVTMRDVEVRFASADDRPAIVLDDVGDANFHALRAQRAGDAAFFVLRNVRDFSARACVGLADTQRAHVADERL